MLFYYGFMESLEGTFLVVTVLFQEGGGVNSRVNLKGTVLSQ